jgi:uncharacterized pyridoxal phosphate-containing UPF0001 family protein
LHTIEEHIAKIRATLPQGVGLLCVSKFQPVEAIRAAYEAGERDFGESRVRAFTPRELNQIFASMA